MSNIGQWFGLNGTTCVVAGANGLLGRAVTRALVDCGARVIALDQDFDGPLMESAICSTSLRLIRCRRFFEKNCEKFRREGSRGYS